MAARGDEADPGAAAGDELVREAGGADGNRARIAQHVVHREAAALRHILERIDHPLAGIARNREALVGQDRAGLVDDDAVGERPAHVDADDVPHQPFLFQAAVISATGTTYGPMIFSAHSCSSGT